MPTLVRSAFNPNGTYVTDGMDPVDSQAKELAFRQREMLLNRMDQNGWHMADIGERGREFNAQQGLAMQGLTAQERMHNADLGFNREGRQIESDRAGKMFDYAKGHDEREDAWRHTTFDADKAGRDASNNMMTAQSQAMMASLKRMEDENTRHRAAQNVPAPADLSTAPEETRAKYQTDLATSDPATASANYAASMTAKKREEADIVAGALKNKIADFKDRDTSYLSSDPDAAEVEDLGQQHARLVDQYVGAGMSRSAAITKANEVVGSLSDSNHAMAGWTKALYKRLGIR